MRDQFSSYYRPTADEFSSIWKNCLFAFDANFLLDFYRYAPPTRDTVFDVLEKISDRLWLPHRSALEFHRNRVQVIADIWKPYNEIKTALDAATNDTVSKINGYSHKHPFIDFKHVRDLLQQKIKEVGQLLDEAAGNHPNLLDNLDSDSVLAKLTKLFDGKVGPEYSTTRLEEIYKEASERYSRKIPPGFKDSAKEGNKVYGDVVMWYELVDHSKEAKVPLIFVTSETKEDWWYKCQGRVIGPLPELRQEFETRSGQRFYMYQPEQFLKTALEFLKAKPEQKVLDEVKDVAKLRSAWDQLITESWATAALAGAATRRRLRPARGLVREVERELNKAESAKSDPKGVQQRLDVADVKDPQNLKQEP